jgi:hypothetical protein
LDETAKCFGNYAKYASLCFRENNDTIVFYRSAADGNHKLIFFYAKVLLSYELNGQSDVTRKPPAKAFWTALKWLQLLLKYQLFKRKYF